MSLSAAPSRLSRLVVALLAMLLVLPVAQLLGAAPARAAANVAEGTVVDDGGEPLAGVTVTAYPAPGSTTAGPTTSTDADGAYGLTLTAGSYRLGYAKAGFETTRYGGGAGVTLVVDAQGDISVGGEPLEDNLLDDVALTSTTRHPVTGAVTNPGNVPLAGIAVAAHPASNPDADTDTATTNATGAYALDLPSGTYTIDYADPGEDYLPTSYDGGPGDAVEITVDASGGLLADGAATGCASLCTVVLAPVPADAVYPVAGEVLDANDDPISGLQVAVTPVAGGDAVTGTTDAEGGYTVDVPPGDYRVSFSGSGFPSAPYTGDGGTTPATVTVGATGTLTVTPAEELSDNRLNATVLQSISYSVTGRVVTAAGSTGLAGITVRAYPAGDPTEVIKETVTVEDGNYALTLPVGTYDLEFTDRVEDGTSYVRTWLGGETPAPFKVGQAGVLTYAGATVTAVPRISMALPPADATYAVSGFVADANGDGIDGLTVSADPIAPTPADQAEAAETAVEPVSGDSGGYRLLLEAGTYEISVAGGDDFEGQTLSDDGDVSTVQVTDTGLVRVDGQETTGGLLEPFELVSKAEHALTGTVVDEGGAGLAGITVTAYLDGETDTPAAPAVTSGAQGAYTVPSLRIGTYVLRFTDEDGVGTAYQVTWLGEGPTGSPVKLGQDGVITYAGETVTTLPAVTVRAVPADATFDVTGSVVDAVNAPIDGIAVVAESSGTTPEDQDASAVSGQDAQGQPGEAGAYHLALEPGSYDISFAQSSAFDAASYTHDGDTAVTVTVDANGRVYVGGTEVLGRVLEPTTLAGRLSYELSGKVTDGTTALPGISVTVYRDGEDEPVGPALTTSSTGRYTTQLPIGTYTLKFSGTVGTTTYKVRYYGSSTDATGTAVQVGQAGRLYVDGDEITGLQDTVMAAATGNDSFPLLGTVVDANYEGLPGVVVKAEPQAGSGTSAQDTTDADGAYELGLVAGTYKVSFEKTGYGKTYYLDPEGDLGTEQAVIRVAADGRMTIGTVEISAEGLEAQELTNAQSWPVTGKVVTEAQAGIGGITAQAFPVGEATAVATTTTSSAVGSVGNYTLSLKVGTYTLQFTDNVVAAPTYKQTFFGGATAKEVKVRTGGQVQVDDEGVTLPLANVEMSVVASDTRFDLKGTVSNAANGSYDPLNGVTVAAVPVLGTPAVNAATATTGVDADGASLPAGEYEVPVKAGRYQLRFSRAGFQTAFLINFDDPSKPVVVTVAANGSITAPGLEIPGGVIEDVAMQLPAPTLVKAPALTGRVAVGQVVTTSYGTWSPNFGGAAYRDSTIIEWFLDGRPADDYSDGDYGQKFRVPAAAVSKRLTYRITIEDPDGMRASAVFTSRAVVVAKAASTVGGVVKKGTFTVTVKAPGVPKPTGKITVLKGKKVVGKGVIVAKKKGVVVIKLKLKKGKHKLTIVYAGTATVAGSKKVVKIKL
ncbi:carboxypeptidase-like regulatory domain-containing protein [Nocardioides lijunqiniae]|uniref:carboxypeptidase-like regulatory domain-containing protein n=1 Tax=Nocardioides lijunqiniae TaxID=2760832 RepID=UPI0018783635|nr:carboxypeptidase-like regulatory domain-containing protein [Nocardioides lijunqiniae]